MKRMEISIYDRANQSAASTVLKSRFQKPQAKVVENAMQGTFDLALQLRIWQAQRFLQTDKILFWIVKIGCIGLPMDVGQKSFSSRQTPWVDQTFKFIQVTNISTQGLR